MLLLIIENPQASHDSAGDFEKDNLLHIEAL